METLVIIFTLISGYYFAVKWVFEKEDKQKIFYILFMTIVFFLAMMVIKMLGIWFLNYFIFFLFFFLVHSFYTNFIIITKINEYFLKSQKNSSVTLRMIILKLILKELYLLEKEMNHLIDKRWLIFDIIQITLWLIFLSTMILHIWWVIDIFAFINKILYPKS